MRSVTRLSSVNQVDVRTTAVQKLQEALVKLLADGESFTTISVERLAQKAGISRATFYLHYRNKGELVADQIKAAFHELRLVGKISLHRERELTRSEFSRFMSEAVEIYYRHRFAIRAMEEMSAYDKDASKSYLAFWRIQANDTRLILKRLVDSGLSHPDACEDVADLLTWTAERGCRQMLKDGDSIVSRQRFSEMLTHVVWNSLANPRI